ncbi:glycoside hydrolase family 64 protein [Micromonospora sp. URMC 105]|uniref:glycoside hydrolase family 64 protein n=1 Tax=Micromonospora sp. URMC 105 TaxID=3423413 RepID=UPI003F1D513C
MRVRRKVLAAMATAAVTLAGGLAAVVSTSPVQAAVPGSSIPLVFKNNSGRSEQIYIYVLGTILDGSGRQGWADASGAFHQWPAGAPVPVPAPDASIPGPANGQTKTINLPKFSGRVYFSYGQKLIFKLATGGLVQPSLANPTDPNTNILFNWSEYTLNNDGLWINSTQVDMFSAPYAVGLRKSNGQVVSTGRLRPGGYHGFFKALQGQPGGWANLIKRRPDGTILRALAPSHGIGNGAPSLAGAMDGYVNQVWSKYSGQDLVVTPIADLPNNKYYGRVSGSTMTFRDGSGGIVTSFVKPSTDSIWGCYKHLDAPNDVRGQISRTLCAGFNRSTLLSHSNQPHNVPTDFYKDVSTNHYSRKIHAQMVDGKAYGFAFDDVGAHESLVHDGSPTTAYITLDPFD